MCGIYEYPEGIKAADVTTGLIENAISHDGMLIGVDYYTAIGHGLTTSHTHWHSIGYNSSIGATQEDLTEIGGTYVFPPDAGIQMTVRSSNANDTAAGTGVQAVEINYLDGSGLAQTIVVPTNGGAVNTTPTDLRRINYFHTSSAGSGAVAAGNITLTNTANTITYAQISAGLNASRHGTFSIPSNKTGYITSSYVGAGSSVANRFVRAIFRATTNQNDVLTPGIFQIKRMILVQDGGIQMDFRIPIKAPGLTDIKVSGTNDAGAEVACYFEGWYE